MNKQNAKYIERFENLIRVMRGLSRHQRTKHFDMSSWGEDTDCGTTHCAAGFCGVDPWFRRRGFRIKNIFGDYTPTFKGSKHDATTRNWNAISEFFGTLPGDGDKLGYAGYENAISVAHPVFAKPESVGEVIRAAQFRIKILKAQE